MLSVLEKKEQGMINAKKDMRTTRDDKDFVRLPRGREVSK